MKGIVSSYMSGKGISAMQVQEAHLLLIPDNSADGKVVTLLRIGLELLLCTQASPRLHSQD